MTAAHCGEQLARGDKTSLPRMTALRVHATDLRLSGCDQLFEGAEGVRIVGAELDAGNVVRRAIRAVDPQAVNDSS